MEFKVLGELEVLRDGEPVDLGAFRQRSVLAVLLTRPNAVVSSDELIERVWGADGTNDRQNSLWVYVSGLRKPSNPTGRKGPRARSSRPDQRGTCCRSSPMSSTRSVSSA